MSTDNNATGKSAITPPASGAGLLLGCLGIVAFSFSFPSAKLALDGFDPWLIALGRAAVAGLLAAVYLKAVRAPRPTGRQPRGSRSSPAA